MTGERPLLRWGSALSLVLSAHAGAVVATLAWATQTPEPPPPPPPAMLVDLAPLPAPVQAESKPVEKPPEPPKPVEKPPEAVKPPEKPKPRKVAERPKPKQSELALPQPAPPQTPPSEPAPTADAEPSPHPVPPVAPPAAAASARSAALPTWQGIVMAHLERYKRYPRSAQARRQQGIAYVAFSIDRQGNVLSVRVHKSSGHDSLDQETLDMLERAQPLPPPPEDIPGSPLALTVPVKFFLN